MTDYPPAYPHGPIEALADDLYAVRGSIAMNPLVRITRNMAIVRTPEGLALVNPIRLEADTERELEALGPVRWVIRLGPMHGIDDPYTVDRYQATFCCQAGGKKYQKPDIDIVLEAGSALPIDGATIIPIAGAQQPECALLLDRGNGVLLTCDAIQHYGDYSHNNWLARLMMPFIGFPKRTIVGPVWLKLMTPANGTLRDSLEKLLDYEFDALFSAHGTFLATGAKHAVRDAIERAYA